MPRRKQHAPQRMKCESRQNSRRESQDLMERRWNAKKVRRSSRSRSDGDENARSLYSNVPSRTTGNNCGVNPSLIFANWGTQSDHPNFLTRTRFSRGFPREKDTRGKFTCDEVRSESRRSTVADSSSELAEPRGIPRGMRR